MIFNLFCSLIEFSLSFICYDSYIRCNHTGFFYFSIIYCALFLLTFCLGIGMLDFTLMKKMKAKNV